MTELRPGGTADRTPDRRHERRELSVRAVALFGLGLLLVLGAVHFGMGAMFGSLRRDAEHRDVLPSPTAEPRLLPPAPRLEVTPQRDLEALKRVETERLGTYGWIDRSRGVVRIPIDRAVELVAQRGLPTRKAPERDRGDH
jgi:hypothetical protein